MLTCTWSKLIFIPTFFLFPWPAGYPRRAHRVFCAPFSWWCPCGLNFIPVSISFTFLLLHSLSLLIKSVFLPYFMIAQKVRHKTLGISLGNFFTSLLTFQIFPIPTPTCTTIITIVTTICVNALVFTWISSPPFQYQFPVINLIVVPSCNYQKICFICSISNWVAAVICFFTSFYLF